MKYNSLNSAFIPAAKGESVPHHSVLLEQDVPADTFNEFYDSMKQEVRSMAVDDFLSFTRSVTDSVTASPFTKGVTCQLAASLLVTHNQPDTAIAYAADAVTFLSEEPRRKDEAFLEVLGSLLYDIALIHVERNEYKPAERSLNKSIKIFERLTSVASERYSSAHTFAVNAVTSAFKSRIKQANMLAHYQVATSLYSELAMDGAGEATSMLIDSLALEGVTLQKMGKYRDSIQYLAKAMRFLTKMEPEFTHRHLRLSIDLGKALLNARGSHSKGVHLLNTLLQKAVKLKAKAETEEIKTLLDNDSMNKLNVLRLWYKFFPR